ncbi:MAG: hypothetical protein ABI651_12965 [Verrucomicrobiota bacterium]
MNTSTKRPPEAFRSANLFDSGIGYVVVSRFKSDGQVESGVFLLDAFCLGIKNAFFSRLNQSEYESRLMERVFEKSGPEPLTPACARKLVQDAVTYAQHLGFAPHPDYKKACRVFGGISVAECNEIFTFGKDGRPCFIQGPNDSELFCQKAMTLLTIRCGEGNFDYIVVADGMSGLDL